MRWTMQSLENVYLVIDLDAGFVITYVVVTRCMFEQEVLVARVIVSRLVTLLCSW